jgi:hypothetical protein
VNRQVAGAVTGLLGLAALAAWAIAGPDERLGPRAAADRPALALVTSLPLIFGESFGLDAGGSPALARIEQRYNVVPIGIADASSLKGQTLLLMAHPRAQPAEALVELDQWVRNGGHVLLLADPKLDWPSERPLGDRLRPPPAFADTGLLNHWGLTLAGPRAEGSVSYEAGPYLIVASSPGTLASSGGCEVDTGRLIARCRIGKGLATVIADADFLDLGDSTPRATIENNLNLLIDELARLDSR